MIAIGIDIESVVVQCYDSFIERAAKRAKTKTFANIKTFAFAITLVSPAPASNSVNYKLWETIFGNSKMRYSGLLRMLLFC